MAAEGPTPIDVLFGKLDGQINNGQTKKALKTTDEILKLSANDTDAILCKVALLIDLGSIDEAIKVIDGQPNLAESLAFDRAYCLYRLGRLDECLTALNSVPEDRAVAKLQLQAQVYYRQGDYKEAITLYTQLFQEHKTDSKNIQANVLAAYIAGNRASELPSVMQTMRVGPTDTFEIAFNYACALIENGDLNKADEQLQHARRVGEESLYEDGLDEEEIDAELAPVTAQSAFINQKQGLYTEALEMYASILELSADDITTGSVAAINSCAAALSSGKADRKSATEKLKRLEAFVERSVGLLKPKPAVEQRLGSQHCQALLFAYASTALAAGKSDVAKEAVRGLEKAYPAMPALPALQATLLSKDGKTKDAQLVLEKAVASSSDPTIPALMRVQLAAASGDTQQALDYVQALPASIASTPAVACTKSALLEALGQSEQAAQVLEAATSTTAIAPAAAALVARRVATLKLKAGDIQGAADKLGQLVKLTPDVLNDPDLVTLYARLVAHIGSADAQRLVQQLPNVPGLDADQVDGLEAAGVGATGGRKKVEKEPEPTTTAAKAADGTTASTASKKKRKRKPRYPKDFDPANPGPLPDPERWVPKWQRSNAKKSKKKKNAGAPVKGSQGAGKVDASLDKSNVDMDVDQPAASAGTSKGGSGSKKSSKKKGRK